MSYRPRMDLEAVRAAYSCLTERYIAASGHAAQEHVDDLSFVRRHLTGLDGPVLDLGCGPGHWTAYLSAFGADVTGVEMVPEFVRHARTTHPDLEFRQGSMTELDAPEHGVAGILSWYSTIHLPPAELDGVLTGFRRLLTPEGVLVLGFFDSEDGVAAFDHAVITAHRWPADVLSARLEVAGFVEVERLCRQVRARPDRRYAAIAARAD